MIVVLQLNRHLQEDKNMSDNKSFKKKDYVEDIYGNSFILKRTMKRSGVDGKLESCWQRKVNGSIDYVSEKNIHPTYQDKHMPCGLTFDQLMYTLKITKQEN